MRLQRLLGVFAWVLTLASGSHAMAQATADGPTALITTYRAQPGARARFRQIMATQGVAQLERWKRQGIFASYQALFTSYAADRTPDMYLILRFRHFTDLAAWQKIEESMPGGLPPNAQAIASPASSETADIVSESSVAHTTKESQFFVLEYEVTTDMPKYISYVRGYAVPQFEEWEKAGVLSSYASYVNQNPAGAPWSSFILLEYKDLKSLAQREVVKDRARTQLAATNSTWKKWSEDKTSIRKEQAAIPVRALVP